MLLQQLRHQAQLLELTADQTEISFISEAQYDPTTGRVTFKLNNLDRFHTYDIKNFQIGGVKIDHLASSTRLKFTPTVQKIFLADLEVKDLKTGTTGSNTGSGNTATVGSSTPQLQEASTLQKKMDQKFLEM
ncbi:hypothetical protein [Mesomycoplasma ovipneumoniae]|uniref:hypothetical protein n=1 Tax=Mesomycoplasma ovipneumoniae TaxID=29562 RepID=UPI00311B1F37